MAGDPHLLDNRLRPPADDDLLTHDLCLLPGALELVAMRVGRVETLDEEILHVVLAVGQPPGDMLVMPDHHAGRAGQAGAGHMEIAAVEMILIPERRYLQNEVNIVRQQWLAGDGSCAA